MRNAREPGALSAWGGKTTRGPPERIPASPSLAGEAAEAQKAIVVSGVIVTAQFAIFLAVGLALWGYYEGAAAGELGLTRDDEIFPLFIIEGMPAGLSGLLLAGILAAAMSTLSSSLSALSSSTVTDVVGKLRRAPLTDQQGLRVGRWATIGWGLAFITRPRSSAPTRATSWSSRSASPASATAGCSAPSCSAL